MNLDILLGENWLRRKLRIVVIFAEKYLGESYISPMMREQRVSSSGIEPFTRTPGRDQAQNMIEERA